MYNSHCSHCRGMQISRVIPGICKAGELGGLREAGLNVCQECGEWGASLLLLSGRVGGGVGDVAQMSSNC